MGFSSLQILWWINFCLVWFPWWLQQGAMDPLEGTPFGETVDWLHFRIYNFQFGNSSKSSETISLFPGFTPSIDVLNNVPLCLASISFLHRWQPYETSISTFARETDRSHSITWTGFRTCFRYGSSSFWYFRWGQPVVHLINELASRPCPIWVERSRSLKGVTHDLCIEGLNPFWLVLFFIN